ncbi:glycerate kinase [Terribacillus halophilus]|uniref:Glycerate kinase n=1 Tax=Terribacillus halophilus TaxID=361279 RepID=A0A1G6T4Y4_9BACI|nr:glycerate kinase [Terribacillus halophilus]SDD23596.1 glycerate kinase [Terribacillus halophilus]
MKVIMIPSGFKECLDADEVAVAMGAGAKRFEPFIQTEMLPMIDGGEGFAKAIVRMKDGDLIHKTVTGPVWKKINSHYGIFQEGNERTAVIEMAAAAGLKLVPKSLRNPLHTTTYGVGELILDALNKRVNKIIIGCGDSGTSDGGAGMAQALGVQFLNDKQHPIDIRSVTDIMKAVTINTSKLHPRLQEVSIDVACNWKNVLCGKRGVARVFGPQKGASPEQVNSLSETLDHYADLIENCIGVNIHCSPGSGASGGLGAGLLAFADAKLHPRFDLIKQYVQIEEKIANADLVITGEGSLDFQTPDGKIPCEVARIAKKYNIPVIAITGTIGRGAESNYDAGIDAYVSIIQNPVTLDKAIANAPRWIEDSVECILRQITIGVKLANQKNRIQSNGTNQSI